MNRLGLFVLLGLLYSASAFAGGSTPPGIAQSGSVTAGHCAQFSAPGVAIDSGAACGTGTAGVTQAQGTAGQALVNGDTSAHTGAITVSLPATITPNLTFSGLNAYGTPASITLTNGTGLPVSTGLSGMGTGIATWLATPSSANLLAALTTKTGTGSVVFATSPTLSAPTITGVPVLSGLSAGTQVSCLGLDSGNNVVLNAAACGAGGGGSLTVTDGTHTISGTTQVTFSGATVSGSSPNATVTVSGGGAGVATITDGTHTQTSTTTASLGNGLCTTTGSSGTAPVNLCAPDSTKTANYTIAAGDMSGQVNFSGSTAAQAITIPAISSTVFANGMTALIVNNASVNVSVTSLASTGPTINIGNGQTITAGNSITLIPGAWVSLVSNGTTIDAAGGFNNNYAYPGNNAVPKSNGNALVASTLSDGGSGVTIGSPTGGAEGAGTLNAAGTIYVNGVAVGGSGCTVSGAAGIVLNNGSSACTTDTNAQLSAGTLSLGASGTAGSIALGNATSGTITVQPVTGALGSVTLSVPAATDTLVARATTDTLTNKTYDTAGTGNVLKINGQQISSVSGNVSKVGTVSGALTSGDCLKSDASGNIVDTGATCGTGSTGITFTDGTHTVTGSTQLSVTGGTVGGTSPNATLTISGGASVINNYITGFVAANDSTTPASVLDIAPGEAADTTNAAMMTTSATFYASASGAWASGAGSSGSPVNKMGNGLTFAASTQYVVCLANNGGTPDIWFDTSATCANRPSGITDTKYRVINAFRTCNGTTFCGSAAAYIVSFVQRPGPGGITNIWTAGTAGAGVPKDVSSATPSSTAQSLYTISVPSGFRVKAMIEVTNNAAAAIIVQSPDEPTYTIATTSSSASTFIGDQYAGSNAYMFDYMERMTDTSGEIAVRAAGTCTSCLSVWTRGFTWDRGLDG